MTHKDIYEKFLIEYDKANVTSSYPSLTNFEIATILDRAYLALIAQKISGNNLRGASFESDLKSIEDLQPLVQTTSLLSTSMDTPIIQLRNQASCDLPPNLLYFIQARSSVRKLSGGIDKTVIIKLVNHQVAQRFMASASNVPWIKDFVGYIEGNRLIYMFDSFKYSNAAMSGITDNPWSITGTFITYIRHPNKFVLDVGKTNNNKYVPVIHVYQNYKNNPNKILITGAAYRNGVAEVGMTFSTSNENQTYIQVVNISNPNQDGEGAAEITILPACQQEMEISLSYIASKVIPTDNPVLEGSYAITVKYTETDGTYNAPQIVISDTANPNVKVVEIFDSNQKKIDAPININIPEEYKDYVEVVGNNIVINPNVADNTTIPIGYTVDVNGTNSGFIEIDVTYTEKDYIGDVGLIMPTGNKTNRVGYFRLNRDRLT